MFKSSALLATLTLAADSVSNYTGTIPAVTSTGVWGDLKATNVAVQIDQKAA